MGRTRLTKVIKGGALLVVLSPVVYRAWCAGGDWVSWGLMDYTDGPRGWISMVRGGDYDGDGRRELVVRWHWRSSHRGGQRIRALDARDLTQVGRHFANVSPQAAKTLVEGAVDLDRDGDDDFVLLGNRRVDVYDGPRGWFAWRQDKRSLPQRMGMQADDARWVEDIDGDDTPDLRVHDFSRAYGGVHRIRTLSGATLATLADTEAFEGGSLANVEAFAHADEDGDGVAEVLALQEERGSGDHLFEVFDGARGDLLRRVDIDLPLLVEPRVSLCAPADELDRTGICKWLLRVRERTGKTDFGMSLYSWRMLVVSTATGAVQDADLHPCDCVGMRAGDLTADGIDEYAVLHHSFEGDGFPPSVGPAFELRDPGSGQTLFTLHLDWSHATPSYEIDFEAVEDADGDGHADLAVAASWNDAMRRPRNAAVWLLSGADGSRIAVRNMVTGSVDDVPRWTVER